MSKNRFRNYYKCVDSGKKWQDDSQSTNDDECPCHGHAHTPYKSDDLCLTCGNVTKNGKDNCPACIKKGAFNGLTEYE